MGAAFLAAAKSSSPTVRGLWCCAIPSRASGGCRGSSRTWLLVGGGERRFRGLKGWEFFGESEQFQGSDHDLLTRADEQHAFAGLLEGHEPADHGGVDESRSRRDRPRPSCRMLRFRRASRRAGPRLKGHARREARRARESLRVEPIRFDRVRRSTLRPHKTRPHRERTLLFDPFGSVTK